MAYSQTSPIVKLLILGVLLWTGWRYGLPWIQSQGFVGSTRPSAQGSPSAVCVSAADEAVAAWSGGVVRFMNPPIDASAWSDFRRQVEGKLDRAGSTCGCQSESCRSAREVVSELRRLVSEMDSAARNGSSPPGDLVRAQERIDLLIEEAWKHADAGR